MMHRLSAASLLALTLPASALAQAHDHGPIAPEVLGSVAFPTSCESAVQPEFVRAVALLHSFWWEAARQAFEAVSAGDPECAMAHWGAAITARGNPFAGPPGVAALESGLEAIEKALALDARTPRERGYIEALAVFYRDHPRLDHRARAMAYEEAMRSLAERFPDDPEAATFYAREVVANTSPTDKTFQRQRYAGAILQELFQARPEHPGLAHYLIHTDDAPPIAEGGLEAALQYADIAPSVPHALHMPSHIFTRLGMWERSIEANAASAEAAEKYEREQGMRQVTMDRAHAWDYLVYAHLQLGQDAEAQAVLREALSAEVGPNPAVDFALAAMPARFALEREEWSVAAGLPLRPTPNYRVAESITHFARGVGAVRTGNVPAAREEVVALDEIREGLAPNDPEWAQRVEAQRMMIEAWIAHAEGSTAEAVRLANAAAELEELADKHPITPGPILPARELQGDLLMEIGRSADALHAYQAGLRTEPNRARTVFGAARAAGAAGEEEVARRHYRHLMELLAQASGDRPELRVARRFVADRG